MTTNVLAALFACMFVLASPATAGVLWDEDSDSDLSGNALAPTKLGELALGDNVIHGHGDPQRDRDFFSFSTTPGTELVGGWIEWSNPRVGSFGGSQNWIVLLSGSPVHPGAGDNPFVATLPHDFILPPPHPTFGLRALSLQESDDSYTIHLQVKEPDVVRDVAPVPEPAPLALVLLGGALLWMSRRRPGAADRSMLG